MNSAKTSADALWLQLINAEYLPLSEQTVRKLEHGLREPGLAFSRIVPVINSDAALTAMLLKRAAPLMSAPGFDVIEAVSRLGKKGIRAIVATAPSLGYLPQATQDNYRRVLLQSTFALRQTMSLQSIYTQDVENAILTAGLLSCLAELHLVGVRHPMFDALREQAAARNVEAQVLAERLLGGPLHALNARIHQHHFGQSFLADAVLVAEPPTRQLLSLKLGYQMAREVARGWRSRDFASVVHHTAKLFDSDDATVFGQARNVMLRLQAEGFAMDSAVANDFIKADINAVRDHLNLLHELENDHNERGIDEIDDLVGGHDGDTYTHKSASRRGGASEALDTAANEPPPYDLSINNAEQEQALSGIARKIGSQQDINDILRTITDAAYETLEFQRVTLALCNPQRTVVKSRFQLGKDTTTWARNFSFSVQKPDDNVIAWCLNLRKPMRVKLANFEPKELINDRFRMIINHSPECVIGPLIRDNKPVAVLYADHGIKSTARISGEQYKSFARLIEDANKRLAKMQG